MTETTTTWTDGECVDCGRETRVNDESLCPVCEDKRDEMAREEQRRSMWATVAEDFGGKAVTGMGKSSRRRLHVPDPNVEDDDEPLCDTEAKWSSRPLSAIDHDRVWCSHCVDILVEAGYR